MALKAKITATEAIALLDQSNDRTSEKQLHKRALRYIENLIRKEAKHGRDYVIIEDHTYPEVEEALIKAGFQLVHGIGDTYIAWERPIVIDFNADPVIDTCACGRPAIH